MTITTYANTVRSFDHTDLAELPSYQALRQALNDISDEARRARLSDFLAAVCDMALTAPYGDCCPRCIRYEGFRPTCWPYAATRNGDFIRGKYRCPRGHQWECSYMVNIMEIL